MYVFNAGSQLSCDTINKEMFLCTLVTFFSKFLSGCLLQPYPSSMVKKVNYNNNKHGLS